MSRGTSNADRFRAFAFRTRLEESDPLVQAREALRRFEGGKFTVEGTEGSADPILDAWTKKFREALPGIVAIPAEEIPI